MESLAIVAVTFGIPGLLAGTLYLAEWAWNRIRKGDSE